MQCSAERNRAWSRGILFGACGAEFFENQRRSGKLQSAVDFFSLVALRVFFFFLFSSPPPNENIPTPIRTPFFPIFPSDSPFRAEAGRLEVLSVGPVWSARCWSLYIDKKNHRRTTHQLDPQNGHRDREHARPRWYGLAQPFPCPVPHVAFETDKRSTSRYRCARCLRPRDERLFCRGRR